VTNELNFDSIKLMESAKIVGESGFRTYVLDFWAVSGIICLRFRDRFDILLEKRPSPDESG
jgi:hypothetical protein